jgi:tetratricopeptide (TPR) repeat protein
MMANSQARSTATTETDAPDVLLSSDQAAVFNRLEKELQGVWGRWGLFLLEYEHLSDQIAISRALTQNTNRRIGEVLADPACFPDWPALEAEIVRVARSVDLVQLVRLDQWLDPYDASGTTEQRLRAWNIRREGFARDVPVPVLCWLRPAALSLLAANAPDLWHWRTSVHRFGPHDREPPQPRFFRHDPIGPTDNRNDAQRRARIEDIRRFLDQAAKSDASVGEPLRLNLLDELSRLWESVGELETALHVRQRELLPLLKARGDEQAAAVSETHAAGLLTGLGRLDEAVEVLNSSVLPVLQGHEDPRDLAIARGRLADAFQLQGRLDEALRIRLDEQVPVFRRLNDRWELALALDKVADIYQYKQESDQALRLRREQVLPAFEALGDRRLVAFTHMKIADGLQARGLLAQAMQLYRQEVLPVFEQVGDLKARSTVLGRIADVLMMQGDDEDALEVYENDVLPANQLMGDIYNVVVTQGKIADVLARKGLVDRALELQNERVTTARSKGYQESLAHALWNAAKLQKRLDFATASSRQSVRSALTEALSIGRSMGRPDVIVHCGLDLAEVLIDEGASNEADVLLRELEPALGKLGDPLATSRAVTLRQRIAATSSSLTSP